MVIIFDGCASVWQYARKSVTSLKAIKNKKNNPNQS